MVEPVCPRCQEPYTKPVAPQEWVQCGACRHRWMVVRTDPQAVRPPVPVPATTVPAVPPPAAPMADTALADASAAPSAGAVAAAVAVPASPPGAPAPPATAPPAKPALVGMRLESDEYVPLETREINDFTRPLISRQHGGGPVLPVMPPASPPAIPSMPPLPAVLPRTPPARARASADAAPPPDQPVDDPFDPGLFDRAERDARLARARQPTMAEPAAVPVSGTRPVVCSSCGHAFPSPRSDGDRETCPVCQVQFLVVTGVSPMDATAKDPLLGRALRGCLIDRKIGEGGMGTVYHACQISLDRSVAIKVLPPDLARNRNFIARFEREAKNLARINHPNILHIYDFGEDAALGIYFMVIEFVQGKDLGEILHQERSLPSLKVLDVIRQAALGLEMAWEKGVIHRDIKPDNLMLTEEGIWKVMDFGLAKANDDDRDVTTVGVRVGTPAFMSPEQCDGIDVDFRSDIYSLGCTAYLALTGRLPFDGETPFSIMLKHKSEAIPSIRDHRPEVPEVVDKLVRRMLAKEPKDRFDNLRELIDLVEELEVRAAGTTSILRKTRGPFRALKQPEAVPEVAGGAHARQTSGRTASPPTVLPGPPAAVQVAIPDYLKPVDPPRARSSGEMPQPATLPPSSSRISTSDRLRANLARVRHRTHQDEVASAITDARRSEESGLYGAAADAWQRASRLAADLAESQQLMARARAARRHHLMRRALRFLAIASALSLLTAVAVWQGTPRLHNVYAEQELAAILATEARDRKACIRQLDNFLFVRAQPYQWYQSLFHTTYPIAAAQQASEVLTRLRSAGGGPAPGQEPGPSVHPLPASSDPPAADPLAGMMQDAAIPWYEVVRRLESACALAAEGQRGRIQEMLDDARRQVAAQDADLAVLGGAWSNGQHAEALALTEAFAAKHPRAGERMPRLQPGRIEVLDADSGRMITDAHITIQPMGSVSTFPSLASPVAVDGVFSRPVGVGAVFTAMATGFRSESLTVAADGRDLTPLRLKLHPGVAWTRRVAASAMPRAGTVLLDAKVLLVGAPEALSCVRLEDGEVMARVERRDIGISLNAEAGPPQWATWMQVLGDRLVVGSTDGAVVRLKAPSLSAPQALHTGRLPVVAWLEKDLTLKAGQRVTALIENGGSDTALRALNGGKELWHCPFTPGRREPVLWASDDRVVAMNDQGLSVRDELDGRELARADFTGTRLSAPVILDQGQVVVVATACGLNLIRIATSQEPLPVREVFSGEASACHAAGAGNQLLVVRADRSLHLLGWNGKDLERIWPNPVTLPGESGAAEILSLTPDHAVIVDDGGVIYLYARSDGRLQRRIAHGSHLVTAPIQCGERLLVTDQEGSLTMYHLPRIR